MQQPSLPPSLHAFAACLYSTQPCRTPLLPLALAACRLARPPLLLVFELHPERGHAHARAVQALARLGGARLNAYRAWQRGSGGEGES